MKKKLFNICFFFLAMGLTAFAVFRNNDMGRVFRALHGMNRIWLIPAVLCAFFFVFSESCMIRNLMRLMGHRIPLLCCLSYSFIGYFYSGITPSASGGQPMQAYCMREDGNPLTDSSVVLLTLAFFSRSVLSVIGFFLLVFCRSLLHEYFGSSMILYGVGLTVNTFSAVFIFTAMAAPGLLIRAINAVESLLVKIHILKYSEKRQEKILSFIGGYKKAVAFLTGHRGKIVYLFIFSFVQRISLYILTWFVCMGFGLHHADFLKIVLLQAAIYVSVEMPPLPGSQGITELLYHNVFNTLLGHILTPSMLVVRGIDFYFLMAIGLLTVLHRFIRNLSRQVPETGSPEIPHASERA